MTIHLPHHAEQVVRLQPVVIVEQRDLLRDHCEMNMSHQTV